MSIANVFPLLEAAMQALALDEASGVQLYDAAQMEEQHHPQFSPDLATFLALPAAPNWAHIQRVLLNQYPADQALVLLRQEKDGSLETFALSVSALDQQSGQWALLYIAPLPVAGSFERFQQTIAHLRAPEGCPWDQKQTHESLRPYLLEETYEVLDALDSGDPDALREELGDLLLQIVLHSQIAVEASEFTMADVISAINTKLIRRHPHVWGDIQVNDENDVKVNWDRLKQQEKNGTRQSRLDGVSKSLPALSQAYSYQDRAARVKFDWATIEPVIAKVHEELDELLTAEDDDNRAKETGDLLFAVVNLARWFGVAPESALRDANARFYRRFHYIEQQAAAQQRDIESMSLDEMDALWDDAKSNGL